MRNLIKNILIVLIAGVINYLCCWIVQRVFGLPIFFDTVIVMAVLFIYGIWQALGTMTVHFIIACLRDYVLYKTAPYLALYMLTGFAIIVVTWLFVRKKENFTKGVNHTFLYIMSAAISSAFVSCLIGGLVNSVIIRYITLIENWQGILLSLGSIRLNMELSLIIGRIPITCLDRVITTFIGYGIYYLYSNYRKADEKNY